VSGLKPQSSNGYIIHTDRVLKRLKDLSNIDSINSN
jgi:hypothetical protein